MEQQDTNIFGRHHELRSIGDWLADLNARRERVLLLAGEAGIGKSHLAAEAIAASGLAMLSGRSREATSAPYAPIVAIARQCLRIVTLDFADAHPLGKYLGLILPEIPPPAETVDRDTLAESVAALLLQATRSRPSVLYIEDIHWADDATFELLPNLIERLSNSSTAFVATYRSDEVTRTHPVRRFRSELRRMGRLQEIALGPLSHEDVGKLVERTIGDRVSPSLARLIHERSQGVPLYVEELARSLVETRVVRPGYAGLELDAESTLPLPDGIRDTVLLRTEHLSQGAHTLLEVASLLGDEFSFDDLSELAGTDDGLEELLECRLIKETRPGHGELRHGLIGETIAGEIPWTRRRSLHRAIAELYSKRAVPPSILSQHWLQAGEHERARLALVAAAELSCRVHAYRDAVRAVNQALSIWPERTDEQLRRQTLDRLARCAQMSGQHNVAVRAMLEILDDRAISDDPEYRADVLRRLATVYGLQGAWEKSINTRLEASEALIAADCECEAATELLAAGSRMVATLQLERAIDTLSRASALATKANCWDIAVRAMGLSGNAMSMAGDVETGSRLAREALNVALDRNLPQAASDVYRRLASSLEYGSRYGQAREAYYEALNYCRMQKADTETHICLSCMSALLFWTGELKQAIEMSRATLDSKHSPEGSRATAEGTMGIIHAFRGETKQARKFLSRALSTGRRLQIAPMELICLWGVATMEENDGRDDIAYDRFTELIDRWHTTQDRHDSIPALSFAAAFFANRSDDTALSRCVEALDVIAKETDNPEALAALSIALGETSLLTGNPADAVAHFIQAVSHLESVELPLMHILAHSRLGTALIRQGNVPGGIDHLQRAYCDTRRLGFRPMAARIGAQLTEAGGRLESDDQSETESPAQLLTPRQREIARLVADGLTNRDIAERLFLSIRTVDMHVRNILDRLDCRSRAEAVKRVSELGILD